jgi:predicted pyridoxine 5'-phosphate oxidase superfamily flavin-nucleotide-binding protein
MEELIEKQKVCFVATADKNGKTNVSPKGSIYMADDETLAFADLYSQKTRANLKANPNIALAVVDLKTLIGYPFKGKAELLEEGNIYDDVVCYLQTLPMKMPDPQYVVKIKVEKIFNLGMGKKEIPPVPPYKGGGGIDKSYTSSSIVVKRS